jgi:hypothetical protein
MFYGVRQLHLITEMRDGCIFKTKNTGKLVWVSIDASFEEEAQIAREAAGGVAALLTSLPSGEQLKEAMWPREFKEETKTWRWF